MGLEQANKQGAFSGISSNKNTGTEPVEPPKEPVETSVELKNQQKRW